MIMIKISVQDFNIESRYTLICQVCNHTTNFKDHPLDLDKITCRKCKTEYRLTEVEEIENC